MGAWGVGSLQNDGGLDWLAEFEEDGAKVAVGILDAADAGMADGYIESDVGSGVIALAEVLAASHGKSDPGLQNEISRAVEKYKTDLLDVDGLTARTLTALAAVMASAETSELYDLWHEAEELEAWLAEVGALKSRLEAV